MLVILNSFQDLSIRKRLPRLRQGGWLAMTVILYELYKLSTFNFSMHSLSDSFHGLVLTPSDSIFEQSSTL